MPTFPICTVWFLGEQLLLNRMSGAPGASVAGIGADNNNNLGIISSGNVFSPGQSSFVSSVTTSTTKIKVEEEMLSVWDFPKVEKLESNGVLQTQNWKCWWCSSIFKGWNATKAMSHCTKTQSKTDIKACTGNIPREIMAALLAFKHTEMGLLTMKQLHNEAFADELSHNQTTMAVALEGSRSRSSNSCSVAYHFDILTLPKTVALGHPVIRNSPLQLLNKCIAKDCCSRPLKELTLRKLSNLPHLYLLPIVLLLA
jgi:hypothetical protein